MALGSQYKTSTIVLNETLMAFEDNFEFLGVVNHDYEQMIPEVDGMPTGGSISVRTYGYPTIQYGQTMSVKSIEQQFETIVVDVNQMLGNMFAVKSTEFLVDRNSVTDLTWVSNAQAMATQVNINLYKELQYHTPMYVGSGTAATFDYSILTDADVVQVSQSIPMDMKTMFVNMRDYATIQKSIIANPTFDQPLMEKANQFMVNTYAGLPTVKSSQLGVLYQVAGTAQPDSLLFGTVVSTDSYKSAVITLTGSVAGHTLLKGDRLTFATTQLVNPRSKLPNGVPLQLIVQANATANGSGIFTALQVECGILDTTTSPWFGNVVAVPSTGEAVTVEPSHKINFLTVKPGVTFATLGLDNISMLDIAQWHASGTQKGLGTVSSRSKDAKSAPINIRTAFDVQLDLSQMRMRIDCQPVYKAFQRYNIALITQL